MDFDELTDRRGTDSKKWDLMEPALGVPAADGLAMWIADMDFQTPDFLRTAVQDIMDRDSYGYFCGLESFTEAIRWWMRERHNWEVEADAMFTTYGLGNGIAIALQALTQKGDEIITFTPVYHEFAVKIEKSGRINRQLPLIQDADGLYRMDFETYQEMLTGRERLVIFCSPHNPAGRVWTQTELTELAAFCEHNDLLLISDEIHADLTFAGEKHLPMAIAAPEIMDRLVMMTSASKTFNIAGARTGTVSIPDPNLRDRFRSVYRALDMNPNLLGVALTRAAYSPEGAAWVDELKTYLEGNYTVLRAGVDGIPGLKTMPMQSTYLAWVDFADTGMERSEYSDRVKKGARIAVTPGHTLGTGGKSFLRFNIGTQRSRIVEAVSRLQDAFSDLQ